MKILIAGATGVLGRRMMRQFAAKGHMVVGLARNEKSAQVIRNLGGEALIGSIFDADDLAKKIGNADAVIHAATSIPTKTTTTAKDWEMNDRLRREGTQALTAAAAKIGAKIYLQQSVVWVARPADNSFFDEQTKVKEPGELFRSAFDGERIAFEAGAKFNFNAAVLRCGGFYAPDATHTRLLAGGLLKRRLPLVGSGEAVSANIHAEDAASAFVAAAEAGKQGLWHVTDDEPTTIKDMFYAMSKKLGAPLPIRLPLWLARLFLPKNILEFFTVSTRTSNRAFKREIGWQPRYASFSEGFGEVYKTWSLEGFAR